MLFRVAQCGFILLLFVLPRGEQNALLRKPLMLSATSMDLLGR